MLKMIVFDMDGLLVDSEALYKAGWLKVAAAHNIPLTAADLAGWSGQSLQVTTEKLIALMGSAQVVEQLRKEREIFISQQLAAGKVQLKPYGKEVLTAAREQGLILALATSTFRKRGEAFLQALGIADFFDYVTFGDQVTRMKPDPEIYLTSLAKAGLRAEEAIAAEDSIAGATAATKAGLPVVLVPDQSVDSHYTAAEKADLNILLTGTSLKVLLDYLQKDAEGKED